MKFETNLIQALIDHPINFFHGRCRCSIKSTELQKKIQEKKDTQPVIFTLVDWADKLLGTISLSMTDFTEANFPADFNAGMIRTFTFEAELSEEFPVLQQRKVGVWINFYNMVDPAVGYYEISLKG